MVNVGAPTSDHWNVLDPSTALGSFVFPEAYEAISDLPLTGVGSGTVGVGSVGTGLVVGGADFGMTLGRGVGVVLGSCPSRSEVMKTIPTTPQATGYFRITNKVKTLEI